VVYVKVVDRSTKLTSFLLENKCTNRAFEKYEEIPIGGYYIYKIAFYNGMLVELEIRLKVNNKRIGFSEGAFVYQRKPGNGTCCAELYDWNDHPPPLVFPPLSITPLPIVDVTSPGVTSASAPQTSLTMDRNILLTVDAEFVPLATEVSRPIKY
jgi:hypothetical protein